MSSAQQSEPDIRRALKEALYAKAPLFVKMRAQIRREVLAEIAARQSTEDARPSAGGRQP